MCSSTTTATSDKLTNRPATQADDGPSREGFCRCWSLGPDGAAISHLTRIGPAARHEYWGEEWGWPEKRRRWQFTHPLAPDAVARL